MTRVIDELVSVVREANGLRHPGSVDSRTG